MRNYKYTLQKYNGPQSRHTCPQCGGKHKLTLYIDTHTNKTLHPTVGKCDREEKCGYHYTPSQYFTDNPSLSKDFHSYSHEKVHKFTNTSNVKPVNPVINTLGMDLCIRSQGLGSNFVKWLLGCFSYDVVMNLVEEYKLGHTKDHRVIFWQIDKLGMVRTGKVMQYNPTTGRRSKGAGACNWVHAMLRKMGKLPQNFKLKQCLFREHLINKYPDKTIAVTESAKSACVGHCTMPDFVWVSTESLMGLSTERCAALKGRKVIFFPDLGKGYEVWSQKIPTIAQEVGFKYSISELLERTATDEQRTEGYDIADYITGRLWQGVSPNSIADRLFEEEQMLFDLLLNKNPNLSKLVQAFDLEFSRSGRKPIILEKLKCSCINRRCGAKVE